MVDEAEAAEPSRFQFMLHGLREFNVDSAAQRLKLERGKAGVIVDYIAAEPLAFKQWSGYEPAPDQRYLESIGRQGSIPVQWHVEAATPRPATSVWNVTVMRPFKTGAPEPGRLILEQSDSTLRISGFDRAVSVELRRQGSDIAIVRSGGRELRFSRP
jgi:hypothetical protein